MTAVLDQVALAIVAAGVIAAGAVLAGSRSWRAAIRVLAEMLAAAGLVRLSAEPGWERLAAAALILVVRRLLLSPLLSAPTKTGRRRTSGPSLIRRCCRTAIRRRWWTGMAASPGTARRGSTGPSMFAALLDPSAREWRLRPSGGEFDAVRKYADESLVLETTFSTVSGRAPRPPELR